MCKGDAGFAARTKCQESHYLDALDTLWYISIN